MDKVEGLQMALTKAYNEFCKGRGYQDGIQIFASHKVFEQFKSELIAVTRLVEELVVHDEPPKLMMKSAKMYNTGDPDGFWFTITDGKRTIKEIL